MLTKHDLPDDLERRYVECCRFMGWKIDPVSLALLLASVNEKRE